MQQNKNIDANKLYEAALQPPRKSFARVAYWTWVVLGLFALIAFAWAEPFSARFFAVLASHGVNVALINYVFVPLVMILRAVLVVESVGYVYHRFFQHVGWLTRRAQVIRRNQKFHWIHHMIIYPIGRLYRRRVAYVPSEKGVGLSWVIPGLIVAALFVFTHGISVGTAVFIAAMYVYAKHVVDLTHARFHEINHPWANSRYFHWLEKIHILHHWDQRTNYTIVFPAMDVLFGTYLAPRTHEKELEIAIADEELTASDLMNWRYLLVEASPAEYAAFISNARQHPRSLKKVQKLQEVLQTRIATHPEDAEAPELFARAQRVMALCSRKQNG